MGAVGNYEVVKGSLTFQMNVGTTVLPPEGKVALSFSWNNGGAPTGYYASIQSDGSVDIVPNTTTAGSVTNSYTLVCAEMGCAAS